LTQEEYQKFLAEQERINTEKRMKALRYENRKSIDEIVRDILNGELFDTYCTNLSFPKVPLEFTDHAEYR
jgi:hypothetical protein